MKRIAAKYLEFLRRPHVARLLWVALLARMPIGMVGFAMLMYLREVMGNFALAGSAVGINFVAMAVMGPVVGRLVDVHGPRRPLLVTGTVQPIALLGVWWTAANGAPFWAIATFAAISGAFASPITTLTRTIWRHRFEREEDRRTAFALDAVTIELNFTLGPAVVALMLATAGASAAFGVSIAAVVVSFLVYFLSGVLSFFHRVATTERHLLGPLTEPRLWLVFVTTFGLTVCFGLLEVGYPAYATSLGMPAMAGVLLGLNSLGSAIGGAVYGGLHFQAPVERQYAVAMGLMSVPLFLHAVFPQLVVFAIVAFVAGMLIAPSITAQSVLVSRLAPAKYATEAFTWSSGFIVAGIGAGLAAGGFIIETAGLPPAFVLGATIMAAMALVAWRGLRPIPAAAPSS